MKNLIKFSIVMVVLCITACTQTFENTSNEVQKKAQGRLVMKVGNESRTIKPTIGESDVKTAVLTANNKEIKRWSGDNIISQIQNTGDILLDVGNYNFTMTFRNAGNIDILTATTSKDIVAGNNSLNFNMKPVESGAGDILITLNWDDPSEIYTITAGLYDIANNTPVEGFADSALEITSTEEQTPIATYSKTGVPVGQYIIKFKSYKDNILLNTSTDVIKVAAGITTSTQITLSKINRQYTISYNLNGGTWTGNFIVTDERNANEKITLPTANDITREGYEFGGWYDDDNNRITEIPSDTAKNISVTAKWYNAICDINNVCAVIASLSGTGPHDILVTGEMNSNFIAEKIKKEFDDNTNIKNVNLDLSQTTGMTEITPWAFEGMSGLSSVILPDSVTSIRDTAFQNCSNLTSINIPNGVTSIETKTFNGCSSLTEIIIPDSVTSIAYNAFDNCYSVKTLVTGNGLTSLDYLPITSALESITIGDSITEIGDNKFYEFTNLKSVTFADNSQLTKIGENAFCDCSQLTEITIPDGLQTISKGAFGRTGVTSVELPDSITEMGTDIFSGCSSLETVKLPNNITSIPQSTFYKCTNLTSIIIPDGVISIGDSAFSHCSQLTSITFPESVTTIGINVFDKCSNLTNFIVHEQNQYFLTLEDGKILCDKNNGTLIAYPSARGSITIPDGITTIAGNAFVDCSQLIDINIPEGVTSIGNGAFGRTGFTSVQLPDSITEMGTDVFAGCSSLETVTLSNSITSIPKATFFRCHNLSEIVIPSSVTSIGDIAFSACSALTSIDIPDSVTTIESNAFSDCSGLESVTIGNGVTSIGETAFGGCYSVKTLVIGNSLPSLDYLPITSALESITIGNSITEIGDNKFKDFTNLTSVTIGDKVESIGKYAFFGCTGLTNIDIDSVNTIGENAFNGCGSLESVEISKNVTQLLESTFFACTSLKSVVIPDRVTKVGSSVFSGCTNLESVKIGAGMTEIGNFMFYDCKFTSIIIPVEIKAIGMGAFGDTTNSQLKTVNYRGTEAEWDSIIITPDYNGSLTSATINYNYTGE